MKLIDADELLLKLNKAYDEVDAKYHETDFDSFYGGGCSMIQQIIKEVEEQLTVYDVDKVVEQLEEYGTCKDKCSNKSCCYSCKDDVIDRSDAIDIVKAGGKNE